MTNILNETLISSVESKENFIIIPDLAKRIDESIADAFIHFKKSCPYCETNLFKGNSREKFQIDHFYPIDLGGQHTPWNVLPICKSCNGKKKNKRPEIFLYPEKYKAIKEYLNQIEVQFIGEIEKSLEKFYQIKRLFESEFGNTVNHKTVKANEIIREVAEILDYKFIRINQHIIEKELRQKMRNLFLDFGLNELKMTCNIIRKEFSNNKWDAKEVRRILKSTFKVDLYKDNITGKSKVVRYQYPKLIWNDEVKRMIGSFIEDTGRPFVFRSENFLTTEELKQLNALLIPQDYP